MGGIYISPKHLGRSITGLLLIAIILFCLQAAVALNTTSSAASGSSNQISPPQAGDGYTKGNLLYSEDFSSSKSSWYTSPRGDYITSTIKQGKYHFMVKPSDYWWQIFGPSKANFTDFVLEVETTEEAGPDDNVFGVVVREVDISDYYAFLLSNDGYFKVIRKFNGTWDAVDWSKDTANAIKPGSAPNLIAVTARGDKFGLYVNGVKLADYNNSSFSYGGIGFFVGSQSEGNVTVGFDNLKVWEMK